MEHSQQQNTLGAEEKSFVQEAIVEENYKCAASLRDQIQELEVSDPVRALKAQLESAVNAEDFSVGRLHRACQIHENIATLLSHVAQLVPMIAHSALQ